MESVQ